MPAGVNPFAGRSHASTGMMKSARAGLTIHLEVKGLDELIQRLQDGAKIGGTEAKRVKWGMDQTVKLVKGQAMETVPYRTGKLKGTLFGKVKVWGEGNVTGNIGSTGAGLEHGPVVPFVLEGGRQPNRRGRMAITPRRWLYHATQRVESKVNEVWAKVLELIVRDLAGK